MKCEACLNQLEEYIDGEVEQRVARQINGHLITCADCSLAFEELTAEQEIYSRYDRELEIAPSMWNAIEGRLEEESPQARASIRDWFAGLFAAPSFGFTLAGAVAVLLAAILIGVVYVSVQRRPQTPERVAEKDDRKEHKAAPETTPKEERSPSPAPVRGEKDQNKKSPANRKGTVDDKPVRRLEPYRQGIANVPPSKLRPFNLLPSVSSQSETGTDVLSADVEDFETQKHVERAQMLLRTIRNTEVAADETVDVSYEKELSRQLLSENLVLRRNAEANGKFPEKSLLSSLEPFLIDIANLPEQAKADDLRAVKDRVTRTEIVAVLQSY